jgi:hypothetical protein
MQPPENVDWLIILAFPNGGSTAIAKLLMTAEGTVALNPTIEGQWLVRRWLHRAIDGVPDIASITKTFEPGGLS